MALFMLIVAVIFRLSLDWIEIQDRRAEMKRQQERDKMMFVTKKETVATRTEEFEMYMYEYGA